MRNKKDAVQINLHLFPCPLAEKHLSDTGAVERDSRPRPCEELKHGIVAPHMVQIGDIIAVLNGQVHRLLGFGHQLFQVWSRNPGEIELLLNPRSEPQELNRQGELLGLGVLFDVVSQDQGRGDPMDGRRRVSCLSGKLPDADAPGFGHCLYNVQHLVERFHCSTFRNMILVYDTVLPSGKNDVKAFVLGTAHGNAGRCVTGNGSRRRPVS